MVFWRNEQISATDEPAERATTPGRAFSRGFLDETDDFRNEHVTLFLRNGRTCKTDEFAERTLCEMSDNAERSVLCGILEKTVVSSNSAESVTVFWRIDSEFGGRTSLWNEQRQPAECFPTDFLRKQTKLGNAQTMVSTGQRGRFGQPRGTRRHYGSGNPPPIWPILAELITWFGDINISRDPQDGTMVTAVNANAVVHGYSRWYSSHELASKLIVELKKEIKGADVDRSVISSLKTKIKQLEREVKAVRTAQEFKNADQLEAKLVKSQEKTQVWKERYDKLFDVTQSLCDAVSTAGNRGNRPTHNTYVHKIKPHEPTRFDGSQNLEVVMQFLNDVEHYVRQGGSIGPKASLDNRHIDTIWRFLTTKIVGSFENEMKRRGVDRIPPADHDYGITWAGVRTAFKKQFVPEIAISVVRNEWHALKFNKVQVHKFNRRALELVEVLGGSLTITRENPLWDEYRRKLPEPVANDISQQARLMFHLNNVLLTLADMMDIVADRTLPFATTPATEVVPTTTPVYDLMDLSKLATKLTPSMDLFNVTVVAGGATLRGSVELRVTRIMLLNSDPVRKSKDKIPGGVTQPLLKTTRSLLSNIGETPLRRVPRRTPTDFEGIGVKSIPLMTARRWVRVSTI